MSDVAPPGAERREELARRARTRASTRRNGRRRAAPRPRSRASPGRKRTIAGRCPRVHERDRNRDLARRRGVDRPGRLERQRGLAARGRAVPRRRTGTGVAVGSSGSAMGSDLIDLLGPTSRLEALDGRDHERRARAAARPSRASRHDGARRQRVEAGALEAVEPRLEALGVRSLGRQHERPCRDRPAGACRPGARSAPPCGRSRGVTSSASRRASATMRDRHVALVGDAHLPRAARGRRLDRERDVRGGRAGVVDLRRESHDGSAHHVGPRRRGEERPAASAANAAAPAATRTGLPRRPKRSGRTFVSPEASRAAPMSGMAIAKRVFTTPTSISSSSLQSAMPS